MASLTFALDNQLKSDMEHFSWVNWSEVNREELNKKKIFEEFIKTGTLSEEDQKFCDELGWYPIDELPMKKSFVKELEKARDEPSEPMTIKELDQLMGLK